jgi:hypothetical protein
MNIKVDAFYPIYYPDYPKAGLPCAKNDEIWISVPGGMSPDRKDLDLLLRSIENTALNKSVRIILLGSVYHEFAERIDYLSKSNNIVMFDSRVPNDVFSSYMNLSDVIMPLIHIENCTGTYGRYRISGSYNLAYGYKIPLYIEQQMYQLPDFDNISLFYDKSRNMAAQINTLAENREKIRQCKANLLSHAVYNTTVQCKRYMDLITY